MVSAEGITTTADGQEANVHILVVVPAGESAKAAKDRALAGQNARAASHGTGTSTQTFSATGLAWDNATATQRYNPAGQPVAGQSALTATQSSWNSAGSSFRFVNGGTTSTCGTSAARISAPRSTLQTVLLHENGHVVGLGHSSDINAIMYPSYQQADCTLGQDDINGIRSIYP